MAVSELNTLVRRCFHRRLSAHDFHDVLLEYRKRVSFSRRDVVSAFLNSSFLYCPDDDPLVPQYLQLLVLRDTIHCADLITGLYLQWRGIGRTNKRPAILKLLTVHARILAELNLLTDQLTLEEARKCIVRLCTWLGPMVRWATSTMVKEHNVNANTLSETVAYLLLILLSPVTLATKQIYNAVQSTIEKCTNANPTIAMQLMDKLSSVPKPGVLNRRVSDTPNMIDIATFQFEANLEPTIVTPVRSATIVLLNDLIRSGSYIDDNAIFSYLNARHQSNHATMFTDILFASIDAIIKTTDSGIDVYQNQVSIFFWNKLPIILTMIYQSAFETFSSETILIDGWNYMITSGSTFIGAIGRRFLHICAVHQLLQQDSVTALIGGEETGALRVIAAKDNLVNQVGENYVRGPRLIDEVIKNDGNAGAICQAIVEIIIKYCQTKDTQHIKDIANAIIRKPASMNIIGTLVKPSSILGPLSVILDEWKWDDIHGESQPVYDEFGSILLLIIAFKQKLGLTGFDLGIERSSGFTARYMALNYAEQELTQLSNGEQDHLDTWIRSLYIAEGLSDDVTTKCSAQNFYLLVPTLLRQSVMAFMQGKLNNDTFKAGLEYLLEPFLLPSLLSVFGWIERLPEKEHKIALLIMQILTKSPSGSEAKELHQTILAVAADRLEQRIKPTSLLAPVIASMNMAGFGLESSLRSIDTSRDDVLIKLIAGGESFDVVQLNTSIAIHGPFDVAKALSDSLIQSADFHSLLDFTATICSIRQELRHALQLMHANLAIRLKREGQMVAGAIVHLHRRVELYNNALMAENVGLDHSFAPLAGITAESINLDATIPVQFDQMDQTQVEEIDMVLNEAAMGGMDQVDNSAFDDMYGPVGELGLDDLDLDLF